MLSKQMIPRIKMSLTRSDYADIKPYIEQKKNNNKMRGKGGTLKKKKITEERQQPVNH